MRLTRLELQVSFRIESKQGTKTHLFFIPHLPLPLLPLPLCPKVLHRRRQLPLILILLLHLTPTLYDTWGGGRRDRDHHRRTTAGMHHLPPLLLSHLGPPEVHRMHSVCSLPLQRAERHVGVPCLDNAERGGGVGRQGGGAEAGVDGDGAGGTFPSLAPCRVVVFGVRGEVRKVPHIPCAVADCRLHGPVQFAVPPGVAFKLRDVRVDIHVQELW